MKILLKKKKKKSPNMGKSNIKIFLKMKDKNQLSIKKYIKYGKIKMLHR